jgi:hypothetical protein
MSLRNPQSGRADDPSSCVALVALVVTVALVVVGLADLGVGVVVVAGVTHILSSRFN